MASPITSKDGFVALDWLTAPAIVKLLLVAALNLFVVFAPDVKVTIP